MRTTASHQVAASCAWRTLRGGGNPAANGFKTVPGSGVVELYGQKHNYVGHVTLLR